MRSMHSASSATSRSPTPDLRQCTRAPPSSSCVTSSPIAARTRCGPASAIEPRPDTIGTKSASPGMYAVPAAHGPISAATCGTTPLITDLLAEQVPGAARTASRPPPGSARPRESSSQTIGIRLVSASSRTPRDLDLAGHAHRAGHHREVVGGDRDGPPVDVAPARDHAVGGRLAPVHRALGEVRAGVDAELGERPVSISSAIRSRAVSLPAACWRAIFSSPPPSRAAARRSSRSSASGRNMPVACQPRVREAQHGGDARRLAGQLDRRRAAADARSALACSARAGGRDDLAPRRAGLHQQRAQLHAAEPVHVPVADERGLQPPRRAAPAARRRRCARARR